MADRLPDRSIQLLPLVRSPPSRPSPITLLLLTFIVTAIKASKAGLRGALFSRIPIPRERGRRFNGGVRV